jgi:hypothetical protein
MKKYRPASNILYGAEIKLSASQNTEYRMFEYLTTVQLEGTEKESVVAYSSYYTSPDLCGLRKTTKSCS